MIIGITNTPRDYAWGSKTAIAELTGRPASGGPEAELWLGAHPSAPATVDPGTPGVGGESLDALIARDPAGTVGSGRDRLPFLMKILAADRPLSLQVHPDPVQAKAGFAREQEAGVPLDASERNYVDDSAKPEVILALSPTFEALAGFRETSESRLLLAELALAAPSGDGARITALADRLGDDGLADTVAWLLRGGDDVAATVAAVIAAAPSTTDLSSHRREFATVGRLADLYPGDPGVVLSLLLNRVSLAQGQVLSLRAGVMHAYLEGVGIEVMSASDNVLRGGLTPKHVDVDELLSVVRFDSTAVPIVQPDEPVPGIEVFRPESDDFVLAQVALGDSGGVEGYRLTGPETVSFGLTGPAVVLCLQGGVLAAGERDALKLGRGDSAFVSPDEGTLTLSGSGVAYIATTP